MSKCAHQEAHNCFFPHGSWGGVGKWGEVSMRNLHQRDLVCMSVDKNYLHCCQSSTICSGGKEIQTSWKQITRTSVQQTVPNFQ